MIDAAPAAPGRKAGRANGEKRLSLCPPRGPGHASLDFPMEPEARRDLRTAQRSPTGQQEGALGGHVKVRQRRVHGCHLRGKDANSRGRAVGCSAASPHGQPPPPPPALISAGGSRGPGAVGKLSGRREKASPHRRGDGAKPPWHHP